MFIMLKLLSPHNTTEVTFVNIEHLLVTADFKKKIKHRAKTEERFLRFLFYAPIRFLCVQTISLSHNVKSFALLLLK